MKISWAGRIMVGLEGTGVTAREADILSHAATGGVVLFTRNFTDKTRLSALVHEIHAVAGRQLLITVDHEGGRVQRFREGFTRLPALATLGRVHDEYPDRALDLAYRHGRVMATELLLCGVDMSFAPVLDLDRESCVIGDRAFSSNPDTVIALAGHYLAGMHDAGMKTCGKHFPGHGSVLADSHVDDVIDARSLQDIRQDLAPFAALAPALDSVMMAHVIYPEVDAQPAGYSRTWIADHLRKLDGFSGLVFSDDLGMHAAAVAGKLSDRVARSLEAGCDAVLVCAPAEVEDLYGGLAAIPEEQDILGCLRGRNTLTESELESVGEWRHWKQSLENLEKSRWA